MAQNYENLEAWKKSISFATMIYKISSQFPKEELYGLTVQIRRAAVSISSNVAEGAGRGSNKEFIRFVLIALGSLNETESQIHIAHNLRYINDDAFKKLTDSTKELGKLLGGFRNYLNKK